MAEYVPKLPSKSPAPYDLGSTNQYAIQLIGDFIKVQGIDAIKHLAKAIISGLTGGLIDLDNPFFDIFDQFLNLDLTITEWVADFQSLLNALTGIDGANITDVFSWVQNIPVLSDIVQAITGITGGGLPDLTSWASNIPLLSDIVAALTGIGGGGLPDLTSWAGGLATLGPIVEALTGIAGGGLPDLSSWAGDIPLLSDLVEALTGSSGGLLDLTNWASSLGAITPIIEALTGIAGGGLPDLVEWGSNLLNVDSMISAGNIFGLFNDSQIPGLADLRGTIFEALGGDTGATVGTFPVGSQPVGEGPGNLDLADLLRNIPVGNIFGLDGLLGDLLPKADWLGFLSALPSFANTGTGILPGIPGVDDVLEAIGGLWGKADGAESTATNAVDTAAQLIIDGLNNVGPKANIIQSALETFIDLIFGSGTSSGSTPAVRWSQEVLLCAGPVVTGTNDLPLGFGSPFPAVITSINAVTSEHLSSGAGTKVVLQTLKNGTVIHTATWNGGNNSYASGSLNITGINANDRITFNVSEASSQMANMSITIAGRYS